MSAYRSYNIERTPNKHKYEVCIYETWVKDIEADWKQANVKTQFDISSSSTGSAGGVFNNEEDVAFVRGLKQWKMIQQQQQQEHQNVSAQTPILKKITSNLVTISFSNHLWMLLVPII